MKCVHELLKKSGELFSKLPNNRQIVVSLATMSLEVLNAVKELTRKPVYFFEAY